MKKLIEQLMTKMSNFNFDKTLADIKADTVRPHILLCGDMAGERDWLIRAVFGKASAEFADKSAAAPGIICYDGIDRPIVLYEAEPVAALNMDKREFAGWLLDFIDAQKRSAPDQALIIWYVAALSTDEQAVDSEIARLLARRAGSKVALLMLDDGLVSREQAERAAGRLRSALPAMAAFRLAVAADNGEPLSGLIGWTNNNLAEPARPAFLQSVNWAVEVKKESIEAVIRYYAAAAAGVAALPLPVSDSVALIALQSKMALHILYAWGIERFEDSLKQVFMSGVISNIGKCVAATLAGSLVKLAPGIGTAVGAVVNAGVATSFTWAMGKALNELCYRVAEKRSRGENVDMTAVFEADEIFRLVKEFMRQYNRKQNKTV